MSAPTLHSLERDLAKLLARLERTDVRENLTYGSLLGVQQVCCSLAQRVERLEADRDRQAAATLTMLARVADLEQMEQRYTISDPDVRPSGPAAEQPALNEKGGSSDVLS